MFAKTVISQSDVQAIQAYNAQIDACATSQTAFNRTMLNASPAAQNLVASCNGAKVSMQQLETETQQVTLATRTSHVAIKAFSVALNMIAFVAIARGVQLVSDVLYNLANAEKIASENADKLYNESSSKVQQNEEEIKTLEALIQKYRELKESEYLDLEGRQEVEKLQNDIANLVGVQAKNLDLVNGKLDEEIKKLNEISKKEAKQALQDAEVNYYNAKKSANKAVGDDKVFLTTYDYAGNIELDAKRALEEAGFRADSDASWGGFGQAGIMGSQMVVKAIGDTVQEKYDYLQSMITVLEQYGQRDSEIAIGLKEQAGKYEQYITKQQDAVNSLVDSWIAYSQFSNDELSKIDINSVDSFENYRQKMFEEIQKNETIGKMMADGILSSDDLETSINNFMATSSKFSTWYNEWYNRFKKNEGVIEQPISFDLTDDKSKAIDDYRNKVNTLSSALESFSSGENIDMSELYQEFPSLMNTTDDLDVALRKLIYEELATLYDILGEAVPTKLRDSLQEIADQATGTNIVSNISSVIDQLKTQLSPAFDSLKSTYQDIFTEDGFTLDNVDISMLDSIKSTLDEMDSEEIGLEVDYTSFEKLANILSDTSSTPQQVQSAFDSLATSILNSTTTIQDMDKSTANLIASMLESMGVANAQELVFGALEVRMEAVSLQEQIVAAEAEAMANGIEFSVTSFLNQAGASEVAKNALFSLVAAEQVFNSATLDTSGKVAKLKELAIAYGQTAVAAQIAFLEQRVQWGETVDFNAELGNIQSGINSAINSVNIDFDGFGKAGGAKSAGGAGKDAADAYLEAFEKELQELDDLKDQGKITEKQYLDALRVNTMPSIAVM